jgi:hypothetical protein
MPRYLMSITVAFLLACASAVHAAAPSRPLSLDDLAKLRGVSDPQVSPDGKWVAYVVGTIDAEKDTRDSDRGGARTGSTSRFLLRAAARKRRRRERRSGCSIGPAARHSS